MPLAVSISSYGCTWQVRRALKKLEVLQKCLLSEALRVFPGPYFSHYGRFAVTGRASIVFVAKRFRFHRAKIPLVSWTKHGCSSLLIPGHDPPLNITIFGDISINPGPKTLIQNNLKRRNENLRNILDLHINTRVITYTSAELLGIRRSSFFFFLCISSPWFKAKWTSGV